MTPLSIPCLHRLTGHLRLQRYIAFREVLKQSLVETFGVDKLRDLLELAVLSTAPGKQGRGYGSALVRALNAIVSTRPSCPAA